MSSTYVLDTFSGYDFNRLPLKCTWCSTKDTVFCGSSLYVDLYKSCESFVGTKF